FYVDNVNGSDFSDGLDSSGQGAGCFRTIQHSYDIILSVIDPQTPLSCTIQLPTDTSTNPIQEEVSLAAMSMTSTFNVNIVGNPSDPNKCHWFLDSGDGVNSLVTLADFVTISFNGISFGVTSGFAPALVQCRQLCIADFRNCSFAANPSGVGLKVMDNGRMN